LILTETTDIIKVVIKNVSNISLTLGDRQIKILKALVLVLDTILEWEDLICSPMKSIPKLIIMRLFVGFNYVQNVYNKRAKLLSKLNSTIQMLSLPLNI
jgi:hypothetical protein